MWPIDWTFGCFQWYFVEFNPHSLFPSRFVPFFIYRVKSQNCSPAPSSHSVVDIRADLDLLALIEIDS